MNFKNLTTLHDILYNQDMLIKRNNYLKKLIDLKDTKLIKIITGIRRSGKSTILKIYKDYLLENEVDKKQITFINFEDIDFEHLTDYKNLYKYIKNKIIKNKKNYVFLDEIQNVKNFEKAIDSLYLQENIDLYITGSNAYMLSSEIATLLSGRYIEIQVLPLSFKEYISVFKNINKNNLYKKYREYLVYSSFPYAVELQNKREILNDYLKGIYNSVILKDIISRNHITNVAALERVIKFMFDNISNISSIKKISDTLTSHGHKISVPTVETYISALINSYILYKINRYDIKGKQLLKTGEKYYLVDIGLRYLILGTQKTDNGRILENIIYLELIRRGYEVYIGKINSNEVDFIAIKNGNREYYQISETVRDSKTLERELKPLFSIKDHYQKFLITLDEELIVSHNGIQQINAIEWLLKDR